jgi:septum formation protein
MLILASSSPRRQQLLQMAGWTFSVVPASIDEQPIPPESPLAYVLRLAESKARTVLAGLPKSPPDGIIIVAADTTVAVDGDILGKPADAAEADSMLRRLRGRTHQVYTGLAVLRVGDQTLHSEITATDVCMRNYLQEEIWAYIATGDPLDKAGAYAIQHSGFRPVAGLEGCYANVVGLPLCRLVRMLEELGESPQAQPRAACEGVIGQPCAVSEQFIRVEVASKEEYV